VLEREVRANLVYRDFTHVGGANMPSAKIMGHRSMAIGPEVLCALSALGPDEDADIQSASL
jgi:hypothetical protein